MRDYQCIYHLLSIQLDLTVCLIILFQLLTLILVCAVNSENVHDFVEPVLNLSKAAQMNIMSIIEPVNNRIQDSDLNELLQDVLCNPGKQFIIFIYSKNYSM